jgi:phage N-6-adenine-methyltransferase
MTEKPWGEILFASKKQDWGTPPVLFSWIESRWGPFGLDAAAASHNTRVERYLGPGSSLGEDSLTTEWDCDTQKTVWINPPYGRGVGKWITRAREQAHKHGLTVVCLIFARTDTKWWHDEVMQHAVKVELFRGRVTFIDKGGEPRREKGRVTPAPAPSCLVVFGPVSSPEGRPQVTSESPPKEEW